MDKGLVFRYRLNRFLKVFSLIIFISLVGLLIYDFFRITPKDASFSNISSSSFTVSWRTESPTPGVAIVVDASSKLPIYVSTLGQDISFDTRDVRYNELALASATQGNLEKKSGFSVNMSDFVTKSDIPMGESYTHHVEVKGLDPEKEYQVLVGDGVAFRKVYDSSGDSKIATLKVPGEVKAPVPAYGSVKNAKNNANTPIESLAPVTDGVIYFRYFEEFSNDSSNVFTSPLTEDGKWYIDVSNAVDSEGVSFLGKYSDSEVANILVEIVLDAGLEGKWKKVIPSTLTSPAETLIINDPNIAKSDDYRILHRIDAQNFLIDTAVKGVNAMEDGCLWISYCGCGKSVGGSWQSCDCDPDVLESRNCGTQVSVQQAVQEVVTAQATGNCPGGTEGQIVYVNGVCRQCGLSETGMWGTLPDAQQDLCAGMTQYQVSDPEDPCVTQPTGAGCPCTEGTVEGEYNNQHQCVTSCDNDNEGVGCPCGDGFYDRNGDCILPDSVNQTVNCNIARYDGEDCTTTNGIAGSCEYSALNLSGTCVPNSADPEDDSEAGACEDGSSANGCPCTSTTSGSSQSGTWYNGRCIIPVTPRCTSPDVWNDSLDACECARGHNNYGIRNNAGDCVAVNAGEECTAGTNSNIANGIRDNNGLCIERSGTDLLSDDDLEGEACYENVTQLYATTADGSMYACEHGRFDYYSEVSCNEGSYCGDIFYSGNQCLSSNGVLLDCNYRASDGYFWVRAIGAEERGAVVFNDIEPSEDCPTNDRCICRGDIYQAGEFCPEVTVCQDIADHPINQGKICNKSGNTCNNGDCDGETSSSNELLNLKKDIFAQEEEYTDYIIDQTTGKIVDIQPGLYTFEENGQTYVFIIKEQDVKGTKADILIYIDDNANGVYDEGTDRKVSDLGSQIKVKTIKQSYKYELKTGYNFVSIPFLVEDENARTAAGLLQMINDTYHDVVYSISKYDSTWKMVGENTEVYDTNDFQLIPGQGYIIKAKENVTISILGRPVQFDTAEDNAPITLFSGWNLIGTYGSGVKQYTAKSLIESINKFETVDFTADNVSKWDSDKQLYDGFQVDTVNGNTTEYGFDFPINFQQAYFVRILQGVGNWQQDLK